MTSEGEAPHPQGAEGSTVAGDSVADMSPEDQEAVERLTRAFPGSKIGEPEPNGEAKTCPNCGRFEHFEEGHEKCAQCEVGDIVDEEPTSTSTWSPVDLVPVLSGERVEHPPSILERSDGQALLYPGKTHMLVGEPEAGKTWLALLATAERLSIGQRVLFIDFENTATEIVGRLRDLGVDDKFIFGLFVYVRPQDPLDIDITTIAPDPALAVLHGITDAMLLHGLKLTDNNDVAELLRRLARPLADAGAAVLLADHVTKDREGRGRWALGAQHKMAGTDVTYALDAIRPFGRGLSGLSKLTVSKDRPGFVRAVSAGGKLAGEVRFISDPGGLIAITISPASENEDGGFRPTVYMERVSRFLEGQSATVSLRIIRANVSGKAEYIGEAARRLVLEGFASMADGPRGSVLYTSLKPFREEA